MPHPNIEVLHWSHQMRLEEKEMIGDDFERVVLRSGYSAIADKLIETGAVTWTTEDRQYGEDGPDCTREGTSRTVGAIAVVRERDEVARYAVQLAQAREMALREALALVDGLMRDFCGEPDRDYLALQKTHRKLETLAHKAVEPGMWRPMWTERMSAYRDVEYLYADRQIHDRPVWRTPRIAPLRFDLSDATQSSARMAVDDQFAIAWRPRNRY